MKQETKYMWLASVWFVLFEAFFWKGGSYMFDIVFAHKTMHWQAPLFFTLSVIFFKNFVYNITYIIKGGNNEK